MRVGVRRESTVQVRRFIEADSCPYGVVMVYHLIEQRLRRASSYGGKVVVESGLYAGDEIVVVGQYNLTAGDAVEVDGGSILADLDANCQCCLC